MKLDLPETPGDVMRYKVFEGAVPPSKRNRGWIEITGLILSECTEGSVKTRIMYRCNLNSKQIQQYLSFLLEFGFLERRQEANRLTLSYHTTERGLKFIETYQKLQKILEESITSGTRAEN